MPPYEYRRIETTREPRAFLTGLVTAFLLASAITAGMAPAVVLAESPIPDPSTSPSPSPTPSADPSPTPVAFPSPAPPAGPTFLGESITFYGRGLGHGVGMSQYGARGRALAGQDATTILAHYYQGATLAPIDPATRIRVLLQSNWTATATRPVVIYGRVTPWSIDGVGNTFPADARLRLIPPAPSGSAWRLLIEAADATVLFDGAAPADFTVHGSSDDSRLQLWSKPTRYDRYRGNLRVIIGSTTRVTIVNDLTLEEYLPGVLPVEMPTTWPAAALQAQSIAARSYAGSRLRPTVSYFDVRDDASSQIYRGVLVEKPSTNGAVAATASTVLFSGTTIANALFHSTGGGATESNENVYTTGTGRRTARPVGYLRGSGDRNSDGTTFDASSPHSTWTTRTYTRDQLSAWFAADPRTNVGTLLALDLRDRGVSGRLASVTLIGTAGTSKVSGEIFRAVFNAGRPSADRSLKSTLVDTAPIP